MPERRELGITVIRSSGLLGEGAECFGTLGDSGV